MFCCSCFVNDQATIYLIKINFLNQQLQKSNICSLFYVLTFFRQLFHNDRLVLAKFSAVQNLKNQFSTGEKLMICSHSLVTIDCILVMLLGSNNNSRKRWPNFQHLPIIESRGMQCATYLGRQHQTALKLQHVHNIIVFTGPPCFGLNPNIFLALNAC